MRYFKCGYPPDLSAMQAADLSNTYYPPGWYASCAHWAQGQIDMMNDVDGWSLVRFDKDIPSVPQDGTTLTELLEADYNTLLTQYLTQVTDGSNGIWAGYILAHRWDNKPLAYCKNFIMDFNDKTFPKQLEYSNSLKRNDSKSLSLPKYLVKNLEKAYLEKFKDTGEVLVSSIARYRTMEVYGQDVKEGIKNSDIYIDVGKPTEVKAAELGRFISSFKLQGPGSIKIFGKIIIKDKAILPDAYVFCASYKILNNFGSANYNIVNAPRFAQTLYESIRKQIDDKVYYWVMAPVIYGGAKDSIKSLEELKSLGNYNINIATMLDCFYKPSSFKDEEEFRFVFFTKKQPIEEKIAIHNKNRFCCVWVLPLLYSLSKRWTMLNKVCLFIGRQYYVWQQMGFINNSIGFGWIGVCCHVY